MGPSAQPKPSASFSIFQSFGTMASIAGSQRSMLAAATRVGAGTAGATLLAAGAPIATLLALSSVAAQATPHAPTINTSTHVPARFTMEPPRQLIRIGY